MKDRVLKLLKDNEGNYVSGEKISEILGVTRSAVWKHIKELKKEGFIVESSSRKGYKLASSSDIINSLEIGYHLNTTILGNKIICLASVDSTNNYAKGIANEGAKEGTVVIADTQTSGKGRLGRLWDSAAKKGIWMSVILRPTLPPEDVHIITLAASVAVVNVIKQVSGIEAGIKWPNDIILGSKKVCGILTEMNSEIERVNYIVLGIGLNVNHGLNDFPEEINGTSISLKLYAAQNSRLNKNSYDRNDIIKKLLFELEQIYNKINKGCIDDIVSTWKKYSVTLGKAVKIISKGSEYNGVAQDITKDGRLVVTCDDGVSREVISGEVSVRGLLGYI